MSKKVILIIVTILIVILAAGGVYYYFKSSKNTTGTSSIPNPLDLLKGKEEVKGDLTYEDASGFSFKYPKGVSVEDVTPDDNTYYTQLDVSKGNEKIVIVARDTTYKVVDDWAKSKEAPSSLSLSGATTLGGLSAKQYTAGTKLYTATVDQGVLYLVEGPKDGGYWEEVQAIVVESFTFAGSPTPGSGSSGGVDNAIYEEEEVVE